MTAEPSQAFAVTLTKVADLCALLEGREKKQRRCDRTTRTMTVLAELINFARTLRAQLVADQYTDALQSIGLIDRTGFTDAARVLKGADADISTKEAFVAAGSAAVAAIKREFVVELRLRDFVYPTE